MRWYLIACAIMVVGKIAKSPSEKIKRLVIFFNAILIGMVNHKTPKKDLIGL
ncbi:hypothetical protein ABIC45_000088 [Mucilaginibacter rubeus]|uniref:hypothetical protein n=1 Tax=Mucilaginibacter rubeus TaxID=2027860 RepID=UPI003399D70E